MNKIIDLNKFKLIPTLFFLMGFFAVSAQEVKLTGVIQDSLHRPLANTNIIATPGSQAEATAAFAISDQKGRYRLSLKKGVPYKLKILHLGYAPIKDSIRLNADQTRNFILEKSVESLKEVVIKSELAMVVNGDTITYEADYFRTGEERKLRGLLENMPGVKVDRQGNVTVNGKKVEKLMVEGKDFFGGDTQLGVNNIPADAVDEVEAIDDYTRVAFMQGLSDSNKMVLNIKLKEGKKKFVFGETEAGGGIEDRYKIHPTLFYYSEKTTVNFIGSLNNTGEAPLNFKDVMRFRGVYSSYYDPIATGSDKLYQFSGDEDIRFQKTVFGAANFTQQISPELHLTAYSIAAQKKTRSFVTQDILYLTQDKLREHRENSTQRSGFTSLSKVKLRYKPDTKTDMAYDVMVTVENGSYFNQLSSHIADSTNYTSTYRNPQNVKIAQYFRYNSRPEYKHTWELKGSYIFQNQNHTTRWLFDRPVFADLIPAKTEDESYKFLHDYASTTHKARAYLKHYWVLNPSNHIYPKGGVYFFNQTYNSTDYQQLDDGTINSFRQAGFNNALTFQLLDFYLGLQYKFRLGKFIVRPGLFYHYYFWNADQFGKQITDENKGVLLPELYAKYEWEGSEEIELNYHLRSRFQGASKYANRLRLVRFNRLYRGNEDLENSLYHQASLRYHKFDRYHELNYSISLDYTRREKSIRNVVRLRGVNRVSTTVYTNFPENVYGLSGNISKRFNKKYELSLNADYNLSDYSRIINDEKIDYNAENFGYGFSARTMFEEWPNLRVGWNQNFRISKSEQSKTRFLRIRPQLGLRYDFLNGFIFKIFYNYTYYENQSTQQVNRFEIGNASLYYSAEGSPWGFEVKAKNIFDVRYKNTNYFGDFIVYNRRVYIQPRTILFILSYKI